MSAPGGAGGAADPLSPLEAAADHAATATGAETVASRREPPAVGRYAGLPRDLPDAVRSALATRGIERLYRHQRAALDALRAGRDTLLCTGTASGKSLPYQLRVLEMLVADSDATVLALYPTKALAADQAEALAAFARDAGLPEGAVARYDGDLPGHRRRAVRASVRALVTNPDMLHAGILPHHAAWDRWLRGLRLIVIDEAHAYRGVFGGHLAGVLRRLHRLAHAAGARPVHVLTSATLGNPDQHARRLTGRTVATIDRNEAPSPGRVLRVVRPAWIDRDLGVRRSPLDAAASLAGRLAERGLQVLVFADARQAVEDAVVRLRARVPGVRPYRSGLRASERRAIERELREGTARVVVATNALELGIDVGGMDAVVVAGWPGSAAAFRQRIGRAGRAAAPGLGVLTLGSGPLDAHLAEHPESALGAPNEHAATDPDQLLLTFEHLRCAVFERPLAVGERFGGYGPEDVAALAEQLAADGEAYRAEGRTYWIGERYPAERVSLRSAGRDEVRLRSADGTEVGVIDGPSARWTVHPGAVYLHDGRPYRSVALDLDRREALLEATDLATSTRATRRTEVRPAGPQRIRSVPGGSASLGEVVVVETTTGYREFRRANGTTIGRHPLDLPPYELRTRAWSLRPDRALVERLRAAGAWSNDPNDYGPTWPRLRARVLARDGHACRVCGAGAAPGAPLHVHHRVPLRAFDRAEDANREENLVTLCPACHREAERAVRVRSGLAAAATVVRALAPLHVLCDARDLGVTADPAAPLADGRPALIVHETVPGGVGLVDALAARADGLLAAAAQRVRTCPCADGCPACVGPAGDEGHAGKAEAAALLAAFAPEATAPEATAAERTVSERTVSERTVPGRTTAERSTP